jgi:hypothetical protein
MEVVPLSTPRRRRATVGPMRKTLIASSLAALAIVGLAGGAAFAAESDGSPATPTTLAPGMDIFADMGLTPEQGDCLVANVGSVDINDMTALMELMTECGISADQLAEIGSATATTAPATDSSTTAASLPTDIDPATASAVLTLLGLDQTAVDCLVSGSIGAPLDDAAAEQVFVGCGVGPAQVLEAIVALNTLAGAVGPVEPVVDVVATSGPAVTSGNAMVDLLLEQLAAQGINLDATQGQCLLDNLSDFDPNDMAAMAAVFETCGINIQDLLPSG